MDHMMFNMSDKRCRLTKKTCSSIDEDRRKEFAQWFCTASFETFTRGVYMVAASLSKHMVTAKPLPGVLPGVLPGPKIVHEDPSTHI
jgi:hypothetical protein